MRRAGDSGVYAFFEETRLGAKWKRLGTRRRAGVLTPLFSVYSDDSCGIGEYPDLELLADWCVETGQSIIQLLPMNDVGTAFRPYDADSTFALEPVYARLGTLEGLPPERYARRIAKIKKDFPTGVEHVNYGVKRAKLALLRDIHSALGAKRPAAYGKFTRENAYWLHDYALYRAIKSRHEERSWETWPYELRLRDAAALAAFEKTNAAEIEFQKWLQWQLAAQFRAAKRATAKRGVLVMGDLPFLVARDSADVWAHQDYFKLDLISGAPPDAFFARGQRWGMPPYDWDRIARDGYTYIKERLKAASVFYDLFRIDHVVGAFRLWTIRAAEPPEAGGLNGAFDPPDESRWEEQARAILGVMADASPMLPCAEDLGVVPAASYRVLHEFGIPGIEVARWTRDWAGDGRFKRAAEYRVDAVTTISTHDTTSFGAWWLYECGTVDEELFRRKCAERGIDFGLVRERLFDPPRFGRLRWKPEVKGASAMFEALGIAPEHGHDFFEIFKGTHGERGKYLNFLGLESVPPGKITVPFVRRALERTSEAVSVFAIQTLQDWLSLDPKFDATRWDFRINFPGTMSDLNWTLAMPVSLEKMKHMAINRTILKINEATDRS